MGWLQDFLAFELFAQIRVQDLGEFLLLLLAGVVLWRVLDAGIVRVEKRVKQGSAWWSVLNAAHGPLKVGVLIASIWVAVVFLLHRSDLQLNVDFKLSYFMATEMPILMWFGLKLVSNLSDLWKKKAEQTETTFDDQIVPIATTTSKIAVVIIGVVMVIQNLGGHVSSLLAGFGIGGAAVAFASKDFLANIFGSVVVFIDRPFQVGDWIEVNGTEGTVEEVGLRVTRIRTFANSQITVPNSTFSTAAIENWSRMRKRRIKMSLGVTYDSNPDDLEQLIDELRHILRMEERINQDFWVVNFSGFGPSSLDIFIYCFTDTTDWTEFLQVRQDVLLEFMRAVKKLDLDFAFPTQTIHLEQSTPPSVRRAS